MIAKIKKKVKSQGVNNSKNLFFLKIGLTSILLSLYAKIRKQKMPKLPIILICSAFVISLIISVSVVVLLPKPEKEITPDDNQIEEPPSSNSDATADWKTYRNEKYEFEFKYPKEYFIDWAIDYRNPAEKYYDPKYDKPGAEGIFSLNMSDLKTDYSWCSMTISEEIEYVNIDDWAKDFLKESKKPYFHEGEEFAPSVIILFEDLNISEIKVKKLIQEYALFCRECIDIIAIKDGYYYIFGCSNSEKKFTQNERTVIEKIISTFKFIEARKESSGK